MITELHTTKFWLTSDGRLEVYDQRLLLRLNRYFKKYDNGKYAFKSGEEGFFTVRSQIEYNDVINMLAHRKSTLRQGLVP